MEFINSSRESRKLCFEGFCYTLHRHNVLDQVRTWRCEQRQVCKALFYECLGERVRSLTPSHTHAPDPRRKMDGAVERTLAGQARTNNACEACHRSFASILGSAAPNFWVFLDRLQRAWSDKAGDLERLVAGQGHERRRNLASLQCAHRVHTIVGEYGQRPRDNYLRGIAHNFNF